MRPRQVGFGNNTGWGTEAMRHKRKTAAVKTAVLAIADWLESLLGELHHALLFRALADGLV